MRLQVQQPAAQQPADAEEAAHQFSTEQRTATLDAASNYVAADQMDTTAIDAVVLQTARGVNSAHLVVVMPCHGGIGGAVSELNVLVVPAPKRITISNPSSVTSASTAAAKGLFKTAGRVLMHN